MKNNFGNNILRSAFMLFFLSTGTTQAMDVPVHSIAAKNAAITLSPIGAYASGIFDESAAEIPAYDKTNKRLFVVKATEAALDVLDLSNPASPEKTRSIDLSAYGTGVNSVDVKGNLVAAAVENKTDKKRISTSGEKSSLWTRTATF